VREKRNYLKGKLEGEYVSYYENGQILLKLFFRKGRRHGEALSYYRDGQVREKGLSMTAVSPGSTFATTRTVSSVNRSFTRTANWKVLTGSITAAAS